MLAITSITAGVPEIKTIDLSLYPCETNYDGVCFYRHQYYRDYRDELRLKHLVGQEFLRIISNNIPDCKYQVNIHVDNKTAKRQGYVLQAAIDGLCEIKQVCRVRTCLN